MNESHSMCKVCKTDTFVELQEKEKERREKSAIYGTMIILQTLEKIGCSGLCNSNERFYLFIFVSCYRVDPQLNAPTSKQYVNSEKRFFIQCIPYGKCIRFRVHFDSLFPLCELYAMLPNRHLHRKHCRNNWTIRFHHSISIKSINVLLRTFKRILNDLRWSIFNLYII